MFVDRFEMSKIRYVKLITNFPKKLSALMIVSTVYLVRRAWPLLAATVTTKLGWPGAHWSMVIPSLVASLTPAAAALILTPKYLVYPRHRW